MIGVISKYHDETFLDKLNLPFEIIDDFDPDNLINVDGLFIDWVSKMPVHEDDWMKQASLLQAYIKSGIPIVIFDRSFSLTEKEVNWVKRFNVYLFEPAINSGRIGFTYLPEWINNFSKSKEEDREYDLVWSYDKIEYFLKEFEKYIIDYAAFFPDKKVAYSTFSISDFKREEYKKNNLIFLAQEHPIYDKGNTTIVIDTKESYKMGYLNPIYFEAMNRGCLPLIPSEHKYFHRLFEGLVFHNIKEMDYFISFYGKVKDVIIEEIFDKIKNEWSEFTIDYATDLIRSCYE